MKLAHAMNIGYPKCATTWLWKNIELQPWFSNPVEKENKRLILGCQSVNEYITSYRDFNITANFATNMFSADRYLIQQLSTISTARISIILRNPYDIYWSLFNFVKHNAKTFEEYVNRLTSGGWFNRADKILSRWRCVFGHANVHVFFYDDISIDSSKFFVNYCSEVGLPVPSKFTDAKINVTTYRQSSLRPLSDSLHIKINNDIDRLQLVVDRDISSWRNIK